MSPLLSWTTAAGRGGGRLGGGGVLGQHRPGRERGRTANQAACSAFSSFRSLQFPLSAFASQGLVARLAGAHAHRLLDVEDEDLAVADLAGPGGGGERLDHLRRRRVGDDELELDLGTKFTTYSAPR